MYRPIVLLDVDGLQADFATAALRVVNQLLETAFVHDDVTQWDIGEQFFGDKSTILTREPPGCGPAIRALFEHHITQPGFCASIKPYPGALEGVVRLREIAEVYALTSPYDSNPHWLEERSAWLAQHLGFPRNRIFQTAAKELVFGDVFVDDKPSHVERWIKHWLSRGQDVHGRLWNQRYNSDRLDLSTVSGWDDVYNLVLRVKINRERSGHV